MAKLLLIMLCVARCASKPEEYRPQIRFGLDSFAHHLRLQPQFAMKLELNDVWDIAPPPQELLGEDRAYGIEDRQYMFTVTIRSAHVDSLGDMVLSACDQSSRCIEAILPAISKIPKSSPFHDPIAAAWQELQHRPAWPQTVTLYGMLFYNRPVPREGVTPGRISINPILRLMFQEPSHSRAAAAEQS
ncbi:MAG TPA: hypothetical protein VHT23_11680 [Gemmatimonadaceae bacterium]|jgi:hypothetical protein|nr:hypothetical protein [Gemmatimonadaceae bacterium]